MSFPTWIGLSGINKLHANDAIGTEHNIASLTTGGSDKLLIVEDAGLQNITVSSTLPTGITIPPQECIQDDPTTPTTQICSTSNGATIGTFTDIAAIGYKRGYRSGDADAPDNFTRFELRGDTTLAAGSGLRDIITLGSTLYTTALPAANNYCLFKILMHAHESGTLISAFELEFHAHIASGTGNWVIPGATSLIIRDILRGGTPVPETFELATTTTDLRIQYNGGNNVGTRTITYKVETEAVGPQLNFIA